MRVKNMEQLQKLLEQKRNAPTKQEVLRPQTPAETPKDAPAQSRIIGLDVALRCTGWGIIDTRSTPFMQTAVDCGVIKNTQQQPVSDCLRHLAAATRELIGLYKPQIAVVEGGFYCRNVHTAIALGAARGAVIATLAEAAIPVFEYAPRKVKQTVCGFGNASKQQVALLVAQFLRIRVEAISNDATDALAMALTHAQLTSATAALNPPRPI